jgi:putative thioredoxin
MATGKWTSEATDQTFEREVIERSRATPVLVDFWAPWCGPCRALTPALEAAVESRGGAVWLVKVNVDDCPATAQQHKIQGVPAIKAFFGGAVVSEVVGALDRRSLEAFINNAFPSTEETALQEAERLLLDGRATAVETALRPALESPRHRDGALILLARAQAATRKLEEAEATLSELTPGSPEAEAAQSLLLRVEIIRAAEKRSPESWASVVAANPKDLEARWALAGALLDAGQTSDALEQLLEILIQSRAFREDGARRVMLAIFEELGIDSDLARSFRKQMMIYL